MAGWRSRFRRSVNLGGGFGVNVTKRGVGVSAGCQGLRRSWHSTGRRTSTVGLPGTGLSWQKTDRVGPTQATGEHSPGHEQVPCDAHSDGDGLVDLARRAQREIEGTE